MLAIQRVFGFYNSARMRAAVEMGDEHAAVRRYYPIYANITADYRRLTQNQRRRSAWTC